MSQSVEKDAAGPSSPRSAVSATVIDHATSNAKDIPVTPKTAPSARPESMISDASTRNRQVGQNKVRLDILLLDGQRRFFVFDADSSVKSVREYIFAEWPQDWPPRPMSSSNMRLLYLGHVLDDKASLCSNVGTKTVERITTGAMQPGQSYVVHLLIKMEPTKDAKDDDGASAHLKKGSGDLDDVAGGCCCVIC